MPALFPHVSPFWLESRPLTLAYAGNGENVSPPMGESVSLHGAEVGFGVGADVGEAGVAHFRPIDLVSAI